MPFVRDPTYPDREARGLSDGAEESLSREALAAFRTENLVGSTLNDPVTQMGRRFHEVENGFDVFEEIRGTPFEDRPELFVDVYNRPAFEARQAQAQREDEDRRVLVAGGLTAVTLSMGAGILDPTILIPGGVFVRAGRAGQIGYSASRTALAGAGAAVGATAVQEAGLQATQQLRTAEESAIAIGGSAILGGLVGGVGARFFTRSEWNQIGERIATDLAEDVADPADIAQTIVRRMESAGAAAVDEIDISDLDVGGPRIAQAVANATGAVQAIAPGVRTMLSPSREVRETYNLLTENSIYTRMNMDGRTLGPSVESLVKEVQRGSLADWTQQARQLHQSHRRAGGRLSRAQFMEAVARAGRRGDVDPSGDEFVTRAAETARSTIYDPLLRRAQSAGLLPEDVRPGTAESYVTRLWNRDRLIAQEPRFREIANDYFRRQLERLPEGEGPDFVSRADLDDYIEEAVTSVFNNLTGRGRGDVPTWMVPLQRGPLKERTFQIPDELVEDFLENDAEAILTAYTRTGGAEIELAERFGRPDMREQFERINAEYDRLSQAATTEKERRALNVRRRQDIGNLEAFRDLIRGTYRQAEQSSEWGQITRAALTLNYLRLLGGVTLSSMTDAVRPIAVHGLRATMREALPALVSKTKAARLSRADARQLGAVTDVVMQSRVAALAELQDAYGRGTAFDRFLAEGSRRFSKLTLLPYWNDGWRTISAVMTQNRMARNARNWRGIADSERAYMAYLGIDEPMAQRISAMLRTHAIEERGITGPSVARWEDRQAARYWAAAMNADVDRTVIVPGVADRPLWSRSNPGKLVFQFKSFAFASHQRALIAGLQERPQRLATSMIMATSLGMLVSYAKFVERGDFDAANRLVENPGLWLAEGLDRTGILSLPFEVSNSLEKFGAPVGIRSGLQALANDDDRGADLSRFASRNALGTALGPTAGAFQDFITFASQAGSGDLTRGGVNAGFRLMPGQNLPGVRTGLYGFVRPEVQEAVE